MTLPMKPYCKVREGQTSNYKHLSCDHGGCGAVPSHKQDTQKQPFLQDQAMHVAQKHHPKQFLWSACVGVLCSMYLSDSMFNI